MCSSRSPRRTAGDGGRDARDVFRESRAAGGPEDVKAKYGDASGKLFDERSRKDYLRMEEVYSLGSRR